METLPSYQELDASWARSASIHGRLAVKSMEISTVRMKRPEATDEGLELIDMRYHQALALLSLEPLFAEGLLDCG